MPPGTISGKRPEPWRPDQQGSLDGDGPLPPAYAPRDEEEEDQLEIGGATEAEILAAAGADEDTIPNSAGTVGDGLTLWAQRFESAFPDTREGFLKCWSKIVYSDSKGEFNRGWDLMRERFKSVSIRSLTSWALC